MWCRNCHQEVAARPFAATGKPACPRCECEIAFEAGEVKDEFAIGNFAREDSASRIPNASLDSTGGQSGPVREAGELQAKIARLKSDLSIAKQQLASGQSNQWRLDRAHAFAHETNDPQSVETGLYNHPSHKAGESTDPSIGDSLRKEIGFLEAALHLERNRTIHLAWGAALAATMLVIVSAVGITTGQMFGALVVLIVVQAAIGIILGTWAFLNDHALTHQTSTANATEQKRQREGTAGNRPTKARSTEKAKS